jgi:hypothetical protein
MSTSNRSSHFQSGHHNLCALNIPCSVRELMNCLSLQVENGDLNWVVPNKLMAFSGPSSKRLEVNDPFQFLKFDLAMYESLSVF